MTAYYSLIMAMAAFSMLAMLICVNSSGTMSRVKKRYFRLLFISVALAAFCEWFGAFLQGTGSTTQALHTVVKAVELSVAPAIGFLIAEVVEEKYTKAILAFLAGNAVLECLSGFFGFIYHVDGSSNYTHAAFYWIYIAVYSCSMLFGIVTIIRSMKRYQYGGAAYLIAIIVFTVFGISVQLVNSDLKTDYITIAITSIMLYVFTLEMIQQTDELTGLVNRRGYENCLANIDEPCVILMFDVDSFKTINDSYGHPFGDRCLQEVGSALRASYAKYGKCFRIGGDEFCVILTKRMEQVEAVNTDFFRRMTQFRRKEARVPYVSIGYVPFDPEANNLADALKEADAMMYQYKNDHKERLDGGGRPAAGHAAK